jgi:recombinational DNA repair ATPase RecF
VLDDVFSELDEYRSAALVERLAAPQTLISTAGPLPFGVEVAARVCVANATARVQ